MKRLFFIVSIFLSTILFVSCEFFLGPGVSKGSISGYAKDVETGQALENVEVNLSGGTFFHISKTDEEGFFEFLDVPTVNTYSAIFELDNYYDSSWNNIIVEEDKVTPFVDPVDFSLALSLVPRSLMSGDLDLSGRVIHSTTGNLIGGASIFLRPGIETWATNGAGELESLTDPLGEFSFTLKNIDFDDENGLHPGYFTVEVIADDYAPEYYVVFLIPGREFTIQAELKTYDEILI